MQTSLRRIYERHTWWDTVGPVSQVAIIGNPRTELYTLNYLGVTTVKMSLSNSYLFDKLALPIVAEGYFGDDHRIYNVTAEPFDYWIVKNKLLGHKCQSMWELDFYRKSNLHLVPQYVIKNMRADFVIYGTNQIIEFDTPAYHSTKEQIRKDKQRESKLRKLGWEIRREMQR